VKSYDNTMVLYKEELHGICKNIKGVTIYSVFLILAKTSTNGSYILDQDQKNFDDAKAQHHFCGYRNSWINPQFQYATCQNLLTSKATPTISIPTISP